MNLVSKIRCCLALFIVLAASIQAGTAINNNSGYKSKDLQEVINQANNGDTISIKGKFQGNFANNGLSLTFLGKKNAVLDGENASSVFTIYSTNIAVQVVFENITIQNGSARLYGGGILNDDGYENQVILNNCIIKNNSASQYGGGIYSQGRLNLENSILSGNSSLNGGGIAIYEGYVWLTNCIIAENSCSSEGWGGGIYLENTAATLDQVQIKNNSAPDGYGGGITAYDYVYATIKNSILSQNNATGGYGGALYSESVESQGNLITFIDSTIKENKASYGGGIYNSGIIYGSYISLVNTSVKKNSAIFSGGGIYTLSSGISILPNKEVKNNSPDDIYFPQSTPPT